MKRKRPRGRDVARRRALVTLALLAGAWTTACSWHAEAPADLVIRGARVWTADPQRPRAEAVAIDGGRIVWVGDDAGVARYTGRTSSVIDAGGRLLLPGFVDSHNHIALGADEEVVQLAGAASWEDLVGRVRDFAAAHPDLPWIEGEGWNYSVVPRGGLPRAADLEGVAGSRPAFLVSYDAHTVWVNREALPRLGVGPGVDRLPFAKVDRDRRTGAPTGLLLDYATLGLSPEGQAALQPILPSLSDARRARRLRRNLAAAARFGITTVVEPQAFLEDLPLYAGAASEATPQPRLQIALFHPRGTGPGDLARFEEAARRHDDDRMRVRALKLYIDDVIEPHTAAMLEPYSDRPGARGDTLYPPDEFSRVVADLDRRGFQLFIHAIGDRGIRTALDALEAARAANGPRDSRHQLVHVECLSPADVPRFAALGVVACMQPRHSAPELTGAWRAAVGEDRARHAWAFRSLREAGAVLAFASDWNVAEMDPLIGVYSAVTRRGLDGGHAWIPDQRVDVETALRAYTIDGAWANFLEHDRGSITPGKHADLALLSADPFVAPERAKDARVVLTLIGGREAWRDGGAFR